jgi:hypothetical protein
VIIGITANWASLNGLQLLGIPTEWWNIICLVVVFVGFIGLTLIYQRSENTIKQNIYAQVRQDIEKELKKIKPQEGSLNNVTSQDRALIKLMAFEMRWIHGHIDLHGLLADRASGVPLNELMGGNCQVCGMPRNRKSKE